MTAAPAPAGTVVLPVTDPLAALRCVEHLVAVAPGDVEVGLLLVLPHDLDPGPLALLDGDVDVVVSSEPTVGGRLLEALPRTPVCLVDEQERPDRLAFRPDEQLRRDAVAHATTVAAVRCLARGPLPLTPDRPLLTAVLITRDEQDLLPLCLDSLRGLVDDVVVCDTGSVDATRDVAAALGARVTTTTWTDDFSAARNTALDAVRGPWALHLDADERVVVPDGRLRDRLRDGVLALTAEVRHLGVEGDGAVQHRTTAFRADRLRWAGRLHERLVDADGAAVAAGRSALVLEHVGHLPQQLAARGKAERNLRLAHLQQQDGGGWRADFEHARALHLAGRRAAALPAYLRCLDGLPAGERVVRALCHRAVAELAVREEDAATGERHARAALALAPGDAPSRLALATALHLTGHHEGALEVLDLEPAEALPGMPVQDAAARADRLRAQVSTALRLRDRPAAEVAALATRLEADSPLLALAAWRQLPGPAGALGRGRAHAALGRFDLAARHLAQADWSRAGPLDEELRRALASYPVG